MALDLRNFGDDAPDADYVTHLIDQQSPENARCLGRLWDYFRNEMVPGAGIDPASPNARPYAQAQEHGLPPRITGADRAGRTRTDLHRKEVVIENDIAWRVQTMVDFLFGRPPVIRSLASDPRLAATIERCVAALLDANGGVALLQEMALLGAVYGFVDVALRTPAGGLAAMPATHICPPPLPAADDAAPRPGTPDTTGGTARPEDSRNPGPAWSNTEQRAITMAGQMQLETIEAPRVLPILDDNDYRRVRYWMQRYHKHPARMDRAGGPWSWLGFGRGVACPAAVEVVEIIGPSWWQRYEDRRLTAQGPNSLGEIPVAHIQNVALAGSYEGLGDVEPLVPLQDELNTRLSDRATRVTYQSFKMYLAKGIDDFLERPVGPGQMWSTQNPSACIEEFGSDPGSPSEQSHIDEIRAALDKVSGVTPLAAGLVRGSLGNLTSGAALKVVLSGLMSRTARKRLTYGAGLSRLAEMALALLDQAGALRTAPADRRIELHWPSPLPVDEAEQLRNAQIKAALGVDRARILAELGYGPVDQ